MLPTKMRLTKKESFDKVFKEGKFLYGDNFIVGFRKNGLPYSRLGFLVGKKIFKKAVLRNRAKRKMRETIRLFKDEIVSGFDIVISCKKENLIICKNGFIEAKKEIINIFRKAKLLKIEKINE